MKTLRRRLLVMFLFVTAGVVITFAQSNPPQNGACFFKDTGYRGPSFCAQAGESLDNLPPGFNDAIRSVRIFGNAQVTAFNDGRFAGASIVLRSDVPDLHMLQMTGDASRNWTERISSLQVARTSDWGYQWGRGGQTSTGLGACFFEDTNFRGRSFCVDRGKALENLPPGFNDRIRSIRVVGDSEVQMFNDNNFGGVAARTRRDVPDLGVWRIPDDPTRNWSGRISSLRVGSPRGGRWDNNGGYRDDDDDRGGDWRNLVRCTSQPGDRQQFCNSRGYVREAFMINAYGTCRKDVSWGIDDGRLWVSNGCSADFQVRR